MARQIPEEHLKAIEDVASGHPEGMAAQQIAAALKTSVPQRTFQWRLKYLVDNGRLVKEGTGRCAKYHRPRAKPAVPAGGEAESVIPLSGQATETQVYVSRPVEARRPVGYDHALEAYRPNVSSYLTPQERARLQEVGKPATGGRAGRPLRQADT